MSDFQAAWKYYQESLKIRREFGDKKGEGWVLYNLGRVYHKLENHEEAKNHLDVALSLASEVCDEELKTNIKDVLSEIGSTSFAVES